MAAAPTVLELRKIRKQFPGVLANDDVDFDLRRGEVHALLGENGAGKSTLMTILYGLYSTDEDEAERKVRELSDSFGLAVDPHARIENIGVGQQQRVEILKALYRGAEILILDEPTGVLTPAEADHLFRILVQLKEQGKTIILITHKLREIMAVTDRVSVMRRGEMVGTLTTKETNPGQLAELMVGRRVLLRVDKGPA